MKQSTFSAVMANSIKNLLQGYTKGIRFVAVLTMLLTIGVGSVWAAELAVNDVLFLENFKGGSSSTSFSAQTYSTTYSSVTMKLSEDASSISRASSNACFRNTSASNMSTHHAWLNKSTTGYVEIDDIPLHNVTKFQASWAQSAKVAVTFYYKFNGATSWTSGGASSAAANASATSNVITVPDGKTSVSIKFQRANNSTNQRIDNLKITVKEVAAAADPWELRGSFDSWGSGVTATEVSGIATVALNLAASTAYEFKFVNGSSWYGNTGAIITDISGWAFSTSVENNARLYTGPAGTYTFKINTSNKQVQVIYPTVTHPAEGYAYFQKQDSWNGFKVYNYTSDDDRLSNWDGSPSVTNTTTICGKTYYYTALATQFQKVIFRDNGSNQWKEIDVSGYSGKYCGDDYNATPQTWKTFNKYSITFNSNGGSGSMTALSGICPGESQTLTANSFARTGYTFNGWNTKADGTGTNYADKATIANINSNITLYAKWKANTYTITSTLTNCSSSPVIPTSYTYTGSAANLTYKITPASGYRLPDAITVSGCAYTWDKTTGQLKLTGTINSNVTITIKAIKVHTITWKVNGQQYGEKQEVVDGQTIGNLPTKPSAPTSCSDKEFMGWTESATVDSNGTGITYISTSTKPDGDKTYHAVFATKEGGSTSVLTDKLTRATTGIDDGSSTYSAWSGKTVTSLAIYAGNSAGSNNSIQLRSNNSNSGIVTTASGGKVTNVSVVWNSNTTSGRTLNVYGKNSAYSAATDLYNNSTQGTLLGTIVYGTSTELTISGDYEYIGLRSASNAMYLTSVSITWSVGSEPTYTEYVTSCTPQYTITLNPNGGTIDDNDWKYDNGTGYYTQTVSEGTELNFPVATKAGYTNTGWKKNNTGNAVASITASENATYTAAYDCAIRYVAVEGTYALVSGQKFELTAIAQDENHTPLECPDDATYTWQRKDAGGNWVDVTGNESTDKTKLIFNSCEVAHCGTYRCHITYGDCGAYSNPQTGDDGYRVHVFHLKGDFENDWNKEYTFTATANVGIATLSIDLVSGHTHEFKIYDGIYEYGNGGTISASVTDWTYGSDNNSNTILQTGADGTYVFTLDFTQLIDNSTNVLSLDVTYPPSNQSEGYTVYYDNLVHNWTNVYYRIGHTGHNMNSTMELVPGTSHLYKCTTPEYNDFEAWQVANNVAWSGTHSIYNVNTNDQYAITHATEYKKFVVVEDITLTPDADGVFVNGENCTYYPATKQSGMKMHKATVIPATGGTITVSYTDHDGTAKSDFTSGDRDLAHTCLLTITATPDAGYSLGTLIVNDVPFTSGNVHTLAEDAVIKVVWTEKAVPTFAWSADSYTAALEADNTFPTLNNPNSLSPITYTSSKTSVATIDANGNITLVATGTTTITAMGAETATYKSATASYTLTVNPSNCRWVEVTDTTTLEDGDEVVVVMEWGETLFTMANNGGASGPLANTITTNDLAANSVADTVVWNISKNDDGTLTFYPYGKTNKWLYCTASYVGVGNNEYNKFIIEKGYLKHYVLNKYLAVAVNAGTKYWHHYALESSNVQNQTLKFYKRECLDSEHYWVEGNLTNVTCDPQLPQQLAKNGSLELTFTAADGYELPNDVAVTNATKTWNQATGKLTISNPTNNVLITIEAVKLHTITWMVGSSSVLTEEVANGTGVTQTPASNPEGDAIGDCADTFLGWSEKSAGSTPQDAAYYDDLCTAADMKSKYSNVTGDKTFYAVFATASNSGSGLTTEQVFATTDIVSSTGVTTGYKISAQASKEDGYYQDGSGDKRYVQVMKSDVSTPMITVTPTSLTVTARLGGGSEKNPLTNSVYAILLDADGNELGSAVVLTNKITAKTGSDFTASLPVENATDAYGVRVYHQKESGYNVRYYAISLSYTYNNISYSDYVTQCCTDWTPTFTYSKSTLNANTDETATPTISGNDHGANVTFVSSNPSVLTVDAANGKITAEGAGRATVTATWEKTGDYCEKSVTSNEITVNGNFTVTFHKNDGSNETSTQQVPSNTATALNANTFQREGYTFQGWAISASGNVAYTDGQQVTLTTAGLNLYAVWKINSYKITTTTAHGTVTTSPANQANYNAQVTITTTPDAHYTVSSIVVTRDDNSQSVTVTNNKFTMPASDVTVTVVFTENPKYNIIYNIPTGGGELVDGYPTFIYSDGSITLPNLKSGSISNEYSCEEFIGWTTNSATHEAAGLKPDPFYAIGASLSGITQNTTLYAVYSRAGSGLGGTVTLTAEEMEGWATAQSYGTERELTTCVGTWKTTGVKSTGNPIQLRATDNPYVEFPELQGNITQVVLNATNGSNATLTSGTFTLKTIDGQTITSASVNSSGVCTLTVTGSHKTARLYSSATARIANISISYGPAAIISTTLSCTNDIDECTVTYDLNESFLAVGTQVLGSCTNSTFRFSEIGEYTICSEPQANEYRLIGWNNQCDGKGSLTFTPGQVISSLPQNIITLYAQWVPEVIVHDSYEETKVYPTEMGGSITLNPGQYICDPQKYEFIGWTTEDPKLWQQQNISPTLLEENQDGTVTFTPTEPSQVYAVYAIEDMANSDAFRLSSNVEGTTYYVGYDANRSGGVRARSNIEDALTFYKEIIDAEENKYLLYYIDPSEQDKEYLYYSGSSLSTSNNPSTNNYGWIFHTSGTGYKFQSIWDQTRYLSITSSNVQTNTTGSVFNIETIAEYKYVAKTNCSETVTITFVPGNGTMTSSTNPVTAKTGDVIKLPTCVYEGWDFLGWVTENIEITEFEIDPSRLYNGNYEVGNSDITLYAYYTQIPESAEFDGTTSEVYKMYCEVDDKYYYAISHGSSRPGTLPSSNICLNAEEWVFTNTGEAKVYYIQDHNNLYLTPEVNNTQLFFTSTPFPWKVVEIGTTNTYRIYAYNTRNDDYSRLIMFQSGAFYHSAKNNEGNSAWHHVTIGGCQNPVYTTDPQPSKIFNLIGSPMITSTINQTVKASQQLQLVLKDIEANTSVTIAGDGLTFYDADNNEVTTLQTGPNGSLTATLTVAYTPTVADNQIVNPAITVTCGRAIRTFYNVSCRSLPADFVIAAKTGNSWVALTANITSTGTQAAPLIMVDNIALPTKATITPNTTKYQLLGLQTDKPSIANSRFKNNGAAVHLYSTNVSKVISASTSTDNNKTYINADAAHEGAANSPNCLFYEWQLQTNDLVHYTLVNSNTTNTSNTKLGYSATYAQWGMYQTGNNVIQEVLLLPLEKDITEMDVEVMEWGTNSMALRFGSEAPATVDVTLGATTTKGLSLANLNSGNTSDIYKVEGLSLADNDCEALLITDATDASKGKLIRKPILVSGDKNGSDYTTRDVCMHSDIVILNGGKLTADEAKSVGSHVDFANIYVYPGGKLVLDGKSLGVKRHVYLRGGYSWLNSTYALPEVYVNGDINFNGSGNMIYDYYIQNQKYYQFVLPYNVQLAKVTDESGADDFPVWVKHYNGALRAADAYATSWEWYPSENGDANAYFKAGIGYIIAAKPRQVGNVANRPLSIIRFPLGNSAFTGGEGDKSVVTTAHGIDGYKAGTVTANNVGWNFIGNPYLSTWKGDIGHKQLSKYPNEANWDGTYDWVEAPTKYITIMSAESGSDYAQYIASETELKPFFPFYLQETADGGSGTINFATANRVKKAPAEILAAIVREAFVQIEIVDGDNIDQTGLYVSDKYSDDIDFDDLEKMFGTATDKAKAWFVHDSKRMAFEAMTENRAAGSIPLGYRAPQEGTYTFTINEEISKLDCIENIYLTDYENGVMDYDLLLSDYNFESQSVLYNDTRFTVRIIMKEKGEGTVTGVDYIGVQDELPIKFIYQDKIFILHNETIYDATGKKVTTINK